jgi:hypothetical protein
MPVGKQLRKMRTTMRRLWWMLTGGQLKELHATMRRLRQMPAAEQLRELRIAMRGLLWKMLRVLTPERFCIPIGNRKRVRRIIRLIRASVSNCRKSVAKKFEMLTVKHVVPNVNWIAQTKVGTK